MTQPENTLFGMDYQGAVLLGAALEVCPLERPPPITVTPLMRKGYPPIPPPLRSRFVRDRVAKEVKVTGVVVTPMTLRRETKEKGWIFQQDPNP